LIGPARVVAIRDPRAIGADELRALEPRRGERLLFKTRNSGFWSKDEFATDYVYLSLEGATYLVERGVRTIGIDYLSIAGAHEGVPTHLKLLRAGVCIIEGLDLAAVEPGAYEMICLPLRLLGADGAPARVVLRPIAG
jgi:arylformamidase